MNYQEILIEGSKILKLNNIKSFNLDRISSFLEKQIFFLVDAAPFYLHIRNKIQENLIDHSTLVDAVSFYLHFVIWYNEKQISKTNEKQEQSTKTMTNQHIQ